MTLHTCQITDRGREIRQTTADLARRSHSNFYRGDIIRHKCARSSDPDGEFGSVYRDRHGQVVADECRRVPTVSGQRRAETPERRNR